MPTTGAEGDMYFQTSAEYYELPPGGTVNQILVKKTSTDRDVKWENLSNFDLSSLNVQSSSSKFYPIGTTSDSTGTITTAIFNPAIYIENNVLFGAAWNDYAEFREPMSG